MKSLTVCESTFVEQKEESKVLKEKGNEKVNLKKNLRSSSKNQKLINVIENSEGDVKCPAVEEDCLEEIDKKFNRNSKTDTVANISGEGGKANSDLNDSTFISSHKNTNTICIKKPEKASNSKTVVVKPKVNNEEFVQVLVEKSFCEKKKEEKNSSKDEGENGEHVTDESKESRDILEVDKSQPKTEKDNELCESVVDLQNVLFPKKQNCLDNDCSSFEEVPIAENSQAVETMILDTDENKENEKLSKSAVIEGFSMTSEEALGSSSKCEIQVGECQTISDSEKESIWTKTESEKPFAPLAKPYSGDSEETPNVKPGKISLGSPKSKEVLLSSEQQQEQEENEETHIVIDSEENGAEGMEFEVEETDHSNSELNSENMEQKQTSTIVTISEKETNSENNDNKTIKVRVDLKNTQKRQLEQNEDYRSAKRKKLEHIEEVEIDVNEENKNGHNSSLNDSSSVHKVGVSLQSPGSYEKDEPKTCIESKNEDSTSSTCDFEKSNGSEKGPTPSSVLANLRGTLKSLTRSDLEELIVQKLCEVITERSTVGELRRKAQALEEDQEKWKIKVQSLNKQIREMEMVMKKYINEVQKQIREGANQVVVPLRVTRSVGLQVSFLSSANKMQKATQSSTVSLGQSANSKNAKSVPSKLSQQLTVPVQNTHPRQKPGPLNQKTPQKTYAPHSKKNSNSRSEYCNAPQTRQSAPQSLLNKQSPNHSPRASFKSVSSIQNSQQQQKQQMNGSKVIDLTEDDDRQSAVVVKSPAPVRVVNHASLSQPPVPQNNRYAYLLPKTSAPNTATSNGQNRQVLIAAPTVPQPNRQLVSMPPLLFKGGNASQPASQSQMPNSNNRVIFPKPLKHPAPLPQQPISQFQRPNLKLLPPRPALKISKVQTGIVLSWNMSLGPEHAPISSYQLFAYQEGNSPPATSLWKKVGDVKALPLPMACTLTQFMSGHKYHFAVRAVDLHSRIGPFSFPGTIVLVK